MTELGAKISRLCRLSQRRLVKRLAEESGRSYVQLRALREIAEEGVRTQAELAERLSMDASSVSRLVDRLETQGLLQRCPGPDRRCVRLAITDAAGPELEAMHRGLAWLDEEAKRHLSEEEGQVLGTLLEKLEQGLREGEAAQPSCDKTQAP